MRLKQAGKISTAHLCRALAVIVLFCVMCQAVLFPLPVNAATATTADEPRTADETTVAELMARGFPRSYAEALLPLTRLHPEWTFEALKIPESWSYILRMETDDEPARNLIHADDMFAAYRHGKNHKLYDTAYYQASREAVAYFMDPRNFFNEADIFQFYALEYHTSVGAEALVAAIDAVVKGTFMEGVVLENGKTYAENFMEIGEKTGVNPIYLAVKARQEQGSAGSVAISGTTGDFLWELIQKMAAEAEAGAEAGETSEATEEAPELPVVDEALHQMLMSYNGLYNLYNVGATGRGTYEILLAAMKRAERGTAGLDTLESAPTGTGDAWNSVVRSMLGGAMVMKTRYVDNNQNNIYFQKFNVRPDSGRRFWGQYMQNVVGSLSEGRLLFSSFSAAGLTDAPCHFRIPVYTEIPDQVNADPADGACSVTASADRFCDFGSRLTVCETALNPDRKNDAILWTLDDPVSLAGQFILYDREMQVSRAEGLEWRVVARNGQAVTDSAWQPLPFLTGEDGIAAFAEILPSLAEMYPAMERGDTLTLSLRLTPPEDSSIRYDHVYLASFDLYDEAPVPATVRVCHRGKTLSTQTCEVGQTLALTDTLLSEAGVALESGDVLAGWIVRSDGDERVYPVRTTLTVDAPDMEVETLILDFRILPGAALTLTSATPALCFTGVISTENATLLSRASGGWTFTLRAHAKDGKTAEQAVSLFAVNSNGKYWMGEVHVPMESEEDAARVYSASVTLTLTFSDGSTAEFTSPQLPATVGERAAWQVAQAALCDAGHGEYPAGQRAVLEKLAAVGAASDEPSSSQP